MFISNKEKRDIYNVLMELSSKIDKLRFDLENLRFKAPHGLRKNGEPRSKPGPKGPRKNKEMKNV